MTEGRQQMASRLDWPGKSESWLWLQITLLNDSSVAVTSEIPSEGLKINEKLAKLGALCCPCHGAYLMVITERRVLLIDMVRGAIPDKWSMRILWKCSRR